MKTILFFITKWGVLLSAWFLSIIITMSSAFLLDKFAHLGSLLNIPSVHMKQKGYARNLEQKTRAGNTRIKKLEADNLAQIEHQKKVDDMIKRNANRSKQRTTAALARLGPEELSDLLGPFGLAFAGGFVAYDIADMCYEINDANELLDLIGEDLVENPISNNCDKVERGSSYVIQNVKDGWSVVVNKTKDGWEEVAIFFNDWKQILERKL